MYSISFDDFIDKVHGCWYGKCLGGAAGAPVEGIKTLVEVEDFTEIFNPDLPNDDLDIQLLWLDTLENKGINLSSKDLADAWERKCWYTFSEYGYFLKNYERGIMPPYSGIINNEFFKEGMGCPIRSEIWGIISAGNPKLASDYAYIDATLDHADNSVYAEQFLAAIESLAFFESNMLTLIHKSMQFIPSNSKLSMCFKGIIEGFQTGSSWLEVRKFVLDRYSHPDFTNVIQNLGFILIALLYGKSDIRTTINIALKCGYDTDCTCASAGAIVGIILGYSAMGTEITSLIKDYFICGIDVHRPSDSIRELARDTVKIALSVDNEYLEVTDIPKEYVPTNRIKPDIKLIVPTENGLMEECAKIKPIRWKIYGPYFEQPDWPMDSRYPSPHGEGCTLPDLVCMVNNEVFLNKEYIDEIKLNMPDKDYIGTVDAFEDIVPIDSVLTAEGQLCVYIKAIVNSPKEQKSWILAGNTDGFIIWVNGKVALEKDEIRYWTPYNNFCLTDLKEGENEVVVKLLRRTDVMKFSFGIRRYNGAHWHRSRWHTDLY